MKAIAMARGETRESLDRDEKLCLALTRLVELGGEAASHVPDEVRKQAPEVPWPKIVGMRHRLIHGYDIVDYDILWQTITTSLPELVASSNTVLGDWQ